jgi:DHA2 family multidrug resistance protein
MLGALQERMESAGVPDLEMAAIKQLYGLAMREAEVMTINSLFHALGLVFFLALLLMPLVKKVSTDAASAEAH